LGSAIETTFIPTSERNVHLEIPSGVAYAVLSMHDFAELRGAGGYDSILLCAPEAISFEIGEEEIDIQPSPR